MDRVLYTLEATKTVAIIRKPGADDVIKLLAKID
jgi:hypothetical protein